MLHKALPVLAALILAGCTGVDNQPPSRTPDPVQAYVDANASQATAVAAVATAEFYSGQLTPTVETGNELATTKAQSLWATQQSFNLAGTERAWDATATSDSAVATGAASATASALAVQAAWTQEAIDFTATAGAASVQAYATAEYGKSKEVELGIERQVLMNKVEASTPWFIVICGFLVALIIAMRWSRVRVIQRDERGDAPLLLEVVDGIAYDADRNPLASAGLTRRDLKLLSPPTAQAQAQTTARDQLTDLAARSQNASSGAIRRLIAEQISKQRMLARAEDPRVEVISPEQARPLLRDVLPHIIQDAIDAEVIPDESKGEEA
jgi:hypothetical protein